MMNRLIPFFVAILWMSQATAQHVIYPVCDLMKKGEMTYALDKSPDGLSISASDDFWDFSALQSPSVYIYDKQIYAGGEEVSISSPWNTNLVIEKQNSLLYITSEKYALSKQHEWVKSYDKPMRYLQPSDLAQTSKKEFVSSWTSYLAKGELRALGVSEYSNLQIEVDERSIWTHRTNGLLSLGSDMLSSMMWLKQTYRTIKIYTKQDGERIEVDNDILRSMSALGLSAFAEEYYFITQDDGQCAAVVTLDELGRVGRVLYASRASRNTKIFDPSQKNIFTLYPTTSFGDLRFDFSNFEPGEYSIIVYAIIGGDPMWSKKYDISRDQIVKEDFSFLPKGSYQYTLKDANHNRLFTRRFTIIKP